jgi:hypothetical protein
MPLPSVVYRQNAAECERLSERATDALERTIRKLLIGDKVKFSAENYFHDRALLCHEVGRVR